MGNIYGYSETWVLGPKCRHTKYTLYLSMYPGYKMTPEQVNISNPDHIAALNQNVESTDMAIGRLLSDGVGEIVNLICSVAGYRSKSLVKTSKLELCAPREQYKKVDEILLEINECWVNCRLRNLAAKACLGWNFMTRLILWWYKLPLELVFRKGTGKDMSLGMLELKLVGNSDNIESALRNCDVPYLARKYLSKHFVPASIPCGKEVTTVDLSKFKLVESPVMRRIRRNFTLWDKTKKIK